MDETDIAVLHGFIKLFALDIECRDFVLSVFDQTLGKIRANEPTGT
jgi:hypothetical protein